MKILKFILFFIILLIAYLFVFFSLQKVLAAMSEISLWWYILFYPLGSIIFGVLNTTQKTQSFSIVSDFSPYLKIGHYTNLILGIMITFLNIVLIWKLHIHWIRLCLFTLILSFTGILFILNSIRKVYADNKSHRK